MKESISEVVGGKKKDLRGHSISNIPHCRVSHMANESFSFRLIDEFGVLNIAGIETFIKNVKLVESGLSYAKVSIMGPQSSGKSTLLNHLFGTNFTEMDALTARGQTTKGIWMAKCPKIEPCTLVMDLEGSDGIERGEDDTAFERQAALFAFAVSDIVIINMWCKDLGRVQAASKPLLRTIFEVMGKLFGYHKTTLLFVLRDKTKSPMTVLEPNLWKDIQQIWDSMAKTRADKKTPLREIFNIKIMALSSYEDKEEEFKEEVNNLRQTFFNSNALGRLAREDRAIVHASGFSLSVEEIWKTIKASKALDLPALKVMVATVRCEQIANQNLDSFIAHKGWCKLNKDVQSHLVPGFGKKLSLILASYLSEYDDEAIDFDEVVRNEKKRQLTDKLLQRVQPAYQSMLEHIRSQTLDKFKEAFHKDVKGEFSSAAHNYTTCFMTQFDEGCNDAIIQQADWNSSKLHEKLKQDIDAHVAVVRSTRLSELLKHYEAKLEEGLSRPVENILAKAGDNTWEEIRQLFWRETQSQVNKFSTALSGFSMDKETMHRMREKLMDYGRVLIQAKARQEAERVLIHMKHRFERFFSHDSDSKMRVWSGKEKIQEISTKACLASLKLLSIMAVVRLDNDVDYIEKTLSALVDNNGSTISLDSNKWEKVPLSKTLIDPKKCKDIWRQFNEYAEPIVNRAKEVCKEAGRHDKTLIEATGAATALALGTTVAVVGTVATAGAPLVIAAAAGGAALVGKVAVDATAAAVKGIKKYRRSKESKPELD